MISSIKFIREFGVFRDLCGDTIPQLATFNLIFGWNYSGKTTLSRVFRCLELSQKHPDYPKASFCLESDDDTLFDETFSKPCKVRVFYEDFRRQNLRWDDSSDFDPIFILGQENILLQEKLSLKREEYEKLRSVFRELEARHSFIGDSLDKAKRLRAKEIKNELSLVNFNKTELESYLEELAHFEDAILPDEEIHLTKEKAFSREVKPFIDSLELRVQSTASLTSHVQSLLSRTVGSSRTIDRLVKNPAISTWVENGLELHESTSTCEFCNSPISSNRLSDLRAHFSKEFSALKKALREAISELDLCTVSVDPMHYAEIHFYAEFHGAWTTNYKILQQELVAYNNEISSIQAVLRQKIENPFENPSPPKLEDHSGSLLEAITHFNELISQNNFRSARFEREMKAAKEKLVQHYVINFRQERKTEIDELGDLANKLESLQPQLDSLKAELDEIEKQLSVTAKGAEEVNSALMNFFGKDDIHIAVTDENKFRLMRGSDSARNLSEGEKTAISFAYFMTKLKEKDTPIEETIVYIDDPISSLDSNHLFNIFAYIKASFHRIEKERQCSCAQLYISTHSLEFFHLVVEWFTNAGGRKKTTFKYQTFMIERSYFNQQMVSTLQKCDKSIEKYKSEYLYLFNAIKRFEESTSPQAGDTFNIGNMTRRFVEGYLYFKYLNHKNIDEIPKLLPDPIDRERARKFMNTHSHSLTRVGGFKRTDTKEAQEIVKIILAAIERDDKDHFAALIEAQKSLAD